MIGLDINGEAVETILEKAQKKGMSTGLVTDVRITHATPAAFAAHTANRWMENEIASDYIKIAPDVLLSGGARYFIPENFKESLSSHFTSKSKRKDQRNLLQEAKNKGYQVIHRKDDLQNLEKDKKLLGLFNNGSLPNALWYKNNQNNPERQKPSLIEMSKAAINKLSQNKNGFFLMIEAGLIDYAGHDNDAGTLLHEMLSFNKTINWVIDWMKKNPDTLLIVTADHETGGFGLSYSINDLPLPIELSGSEYKKMSYQSHYNYGKINNLNILYNQKKSYNTILDEFKAQPKKMQSPENLKKLIQDATSLKVTVEQAKKILATQKNVHQHDWHEYLKNDRLAHIHDFSEYYPYPSSRMTALIGRTLAPQQSVVWGTGTHTASPVHVYSHGKKFATSKFTGSLTHPQLGQLLIENLDD